RSFRFSSGSPGGSSIFTSLLLSLEGVDELKPEGYMISIRSLRLLAFTADLQSCARIKLHVSPVPASEISAFSRDNIDLPMSTRLWRAFRLAYCVETTHFALDHAVLASIISSRREACSTLALALRTSTLPSPEM